MLGNKAEKGRMIYPGRHEPLGFNTTFCSGCSIYNIDNEEKAKECLSCLEKQDEYYRMRSAIESIEVTIDDSGRNVVKAVNLI